MAAGKDYYDILGVKKSATADEIKKAFRRLARKHHPDTGGDEEKFKEINEAYEILSDTEKRQQYDTYGQYFGGQGPPGAGVPGAAGQAWPGGRGGYVDLGDLGGGGFDLGDLFGDVFTRGGRSSGPRPQRGHDLTVEADVDFEQAFAGAALKIDLDRDEACAVCDATGAKPGTTVSTCPACSGTGRASDGLFSRTCPRCGGKGTIVDQPCTACRGVGRVRSRKPLTVNLPPGVVDGGKIRFRGKGERGKSGGPAGDLYVVTRIRPHRFFSRDGADVIVDVPVSFAEAALGTKVTVPAPDGTRVKVRVPAGTQDGTVLKVKGKGAPKLKGGGAGHGDLRVRVQVQVPKELTDEQRNLLEQLQATQDEDLRAALR